MNPRNFYLFALFLIFYSCGSLFDDYNDDGYRDGSDKGVLVNGGSLIGSWEETYNWSHGGGESPSKWVPVNINYSNNYKFLANGTFTSTNNIQDCTGGNGTYTIEGKKIKLKYTCNTNPKTTKEVVIGEYFFRERYIVFIQGDGYDNISKLEFVKN